MILVDTNVLCRLANSVKPPTPDAVAARRALQSLRKQGRTLAMTPQNLYEFWATATRMPGAPPTGSNGLGMTTDRADAWVGYFLRNFKLLLESDQLLPTWRDLVRVHSISGYKCHDTRLVAAMHTYGVTEILTFNAADFRRYPAIQVIDPKSF